MTLALPTHLAPWRATLELFPQDLALTLGAWIPRLAATIGPLGADASDDGEPDGLSGLARRGPYERLLHSEWLMADLAPDEFVRRAVDGEHAFVAVARRQPRAARRTIAVFDAGPDQIGAPRLAHLATLIVLHQRALDAGADLWWGLAHEPDRVHECVNEQAVLALVQGRTPRLADRESLEPWLDRTVGDAADDLWLIGHDLADLARRNARTDFSSLVAHDVLALDRRAIEVRIARRRRPATRFELPLPAPRDAARLLRDPFEVRRAAPAQGTNTANALADTLMFTVAGDRLLARQRDGSVIAWHVPASPAGIAGRPRRVRPQPWDPPEVILGVLNARKKRAVAVGLRSLWISWRGGTDRAQRRAPQALIAAAQPLVNGNVDAPLWRLTSALSKSSYFLWAPDGHAFVFDTAPRSRLPDDRDPVVSLGLIDAVSWYLGYPQRLWVRSDEFLAGFRLDVHATLCDPERVELPGASVLAAGDWLAASDDRQHWLLHHRPDGVRTRCDIPAAARLVGLTPTGELVCVEHGGHALVSRRSGTRRVVCELERPAISATLTLAGDRVGIGSADGSARVVDLASGNTLTWIARGEAG